MAELEARIKTAHQVFGHEMDERAKELDRLKAQEGEMESTRHAIRDALNELGVPGPDYPAPVSNAVEILNRALHGPEEMNWANTSRDDAGFSEPPHED